MGGVARLILLVDVSVCIMCCVLYCLQNNPVFLSVTILSHILKNENYELCFSAGFFVDQIKTGKNYDTVVWPLVGKKSQITVCPVKIQTPTITVKKYNQKKGTVVWPSVEICVKIRTPTTTGKKYNRKHLLCVGWRNYFPVVLLCQFFVLAEIGFGFTYYLCN